MSNLKQLAIGQTSSMAFQPMYLLGLSSCIVQTEYVIQYIIASLRSWHQMEHLERE